MTRVLEGAVLCFTEEELIMIIALIELAVLSCWLFLVGCCLIFDYWQKKWHFNDPRVMLPRGSVFHCGNHQLIALPWGYAVYAYEGGFPRNSSIQQR